MNSGDGMMNDGGAQSSLSLVKEGMGVVDSNGNRLGTVREVIAGQGSDAIENANTGVSGRDSDSLVDAAADIFQGGNLPETVRNRLLHHGYIRVDGGLFQGDRYVLADRVAGVRADTVVLVGGEGDLMEL